VAIDALSLAAIENLRGDTLYAATGGGMGPGTIAALETLLVELARLPEALFCSAADANGPGDRFAGRHQSLAKEFGIPFARLRPPSRAAIGTRLCTPSRKRSTERWVGNNLTERSCVTMSS
jgi:Toprim-like